MGDGNGDNTFIRITNRNIYNKLIAIEEKLSAYDSRISFNRKIALTALSVSITVILAVLAWVRN